MLTDQDKAVLAFLYEDPDAWILQKLTLHGPYAVPLKCRSPEHVQNYLAASAEPGYTPKGPLPSDAVCAIYEEARRTEFYTKSGWPVPLEFIN